MPPGSKNSGTGEQWNSGRTVAQPLRALATIAGAGVVRAFSLDAWASQPARCRRGAKRATHTFMGWSGPESIQESHRDSDSRSGPPAVDARLASLIGIPSFRRGGAGRDWAGGARPTGRTAILPSKNARTWDLDWAASPGHKSASGTEVSRWQGVRLPQATHLAQAKVPGQRLPVGRQASRTWQNPPSEVM